MDFQETDEQTMIREMVRDFAESVLPPTIENRDKNQIAPIDADASVAEMVSGMFGINPQTRSPASTPVERSAAAISATCP